ncbi:MAG: hypothetical protein KatS3mg031_2297 [Chitinophagales bacterium]|nr:MAG: hypothetical protein KatS3mg031_2297 [Chitinophagales bacterium]
MSGKEKPKGPVPQKGQEGKSKEKDPPWFFTRRESEVIDLMLQLKSNEEIARALHISVHTVASYKKRIMNKVRMAERVQSKKEEKA